MDRYDILNKLESCYIYINGEWRQVKNNRHSTEYGIKVNLLYQELSILELYLKNSKKSLDD